MKLIFCEAPNNNISLLIYKCAENDGISGTNTYKIYNGEKKMCYIMDINGYGEKDIRRAWDAIKNDLSYDDLNYGTHIKVKFMLAIAKEI